MKSYAGWSKQQIENHRKQVRDRNKTPKNNIVTGKQIGRAHV